jgi:chromosome segregation ATPase
VANLQEQLDAKSAELKRSSEQSKLLQSQTSSNFAQVEQMKQQVLRDRAELSKKLSMIAPETTRRLDQLQSERDAVQAELQEQIKTITELSQQKSEILARLASEVSRNSALIQHNSELRHQLELQMAALGESIPLPKPPVELPSEIYHPVSTSNDKSTSTSIQENQIKLASQIVEVNSSSPAASAPLAEAVSFASSSEGTHKKPHRHVTKKKSNKALTGTKSETQSASIPASLTQSETPPPNGWLASVPLVGRFMRGQPQVRHTLQVEL